MCFISVPSVGTCLFQLCPRVLKAWDITRRPAGIQKWLVVIPARLPFGCIGEICCKSMQKLRTQGKSTQSYLPVGQRVAGTWQTVMLKGYRGNIDWLLLYVLQCDIKCFHICSKLKGRVKCVTPGYVWLRGVTWEKHNTGNKPSSLAFVMSSIQKLGAESHEITWSDKCHIRYFAAFEFKSSTLNPVSFTYQRHLNAEHQQLSTDNLKNFTFLDADYFANMSWLLETKIQLKQLKLIILKCNQICSNVWTTFGSNYLGNPDVTFAQQFLPATITVS